MKKAIFTLLTILFLSTIYLAQERPGIAYPFTSEEVKIVSERGTIPQPIATEAVNNAAFLAGADYLKKAQADVTEDNAGNGDPDDDLEDGGWDWILTSPNFIHTVTASSKNLYGVTAQGLYYAYLESNDPTYMTAMLDAANFMIGDVDVRSAPDYVFLMNLQDLPGVTPNVFEDAAKAKFDGRIATYGSATGLAEYIRDVRGITQGYENGIIPWDISKYVIAAKMLNDRFPGLGYDIAADDMAEVIYQDTYNDLPGFFDLEDDKTNYWYTLGITGLIEAFSSANVHTAEIAGLVSILFECQYPSGAFSYYHGATLDDEDWQTTAYTVLSLANLDQATYQKEINYACYWTTLTQDPVSGGWVYSDDTHYPEIGGENTAALCFGAKPSEVWVDDDWAGTTPGDIVDGHLFGYDAFDNIGDAIAGVEGSTVNVAAGTYSLAQILIDQNLLLQGAGKGVTVVNSSYNTANDGHGDDASAWVRTAPGTTVDIADMTFDATGFDTYAALRFQSSGSVSNAAINEVKHSASQYRGIAIQVLDGNVDVTGCDFTEIGRIGVHYRNGVIPAAVISGTFDNNNYTGKGDGDWLDYALDISGGVTVVVSNSTVTGNTGVALSDGSTSGGVMATTYFPFGLNVPNDVTITNNELTGNTDGIVVGFDASDVSVVVANNNNIYGNTSSGVSSIAQTVDATNNWWGDASGPSGFGPGTGDAVSDFVTFDPWIGKAETLPASGAVPLTINFPTSGVDITFNTLPVGGGTVTVQRYNEAPSGYPAPPAGATNAGLWLDITSSMPNFSFSADVTVDVTGLGFDASTSIMYYNSITTTWVVINNGTYDPGPPVETYTFTTNHFTPFSFINTPATAYNIYMASDPTATASSVIYPNDAWATTSYEGDDWGFTTTPIDLYIVPEIDAFFGASDIVLQWDNTLYSFAGVDETGGLFDGASFQFLFNQLGAVDQVTINASRLDNNNFTAVSGNFIAKLQLNLLQPGFGPINFTSMDFRAYDGIGGFDGVYVVGNGAAVKSYLGDVTAPGDPSTGDGLVDFEDLTLWTNSYWSGVTGFAGGMTNYKVKYDVGPTTDNTVYTLPLEDGKIQFEDMVIFAISYGLSGDNIYPKIAPAPETPVELHVGEPMYVGNETLVPLSLKGTVVDVRALELSFGGSFGKLVSVEKGALLQSVEAPVVIMDRSTVNSANVDLAIFGADVEGLNAEGELITLRFEGRADVQLSSANVRNSGNNSMKIEIANSNINAIPTSFALDQNYPNPFNPSTIISFQLPEQQYVNVVVFNMLGEEVSTLVNEVKEAGYHKVEWSGTNLTSGVYFYRIEAGDFVSVKKMMLMK